jgi:hypothetical protein
MATQSCLNRDQSLILRLVSAFDAVSGYEGAMPGTFLPLHSASDIRLLIEKGLIEQRDFTREGCRRIRGVKLTEKGRRAVEACGYGK